MNLLDKKIERTAFEYFTSLGMHESLVQFKITELKILVDRGYNTPAQILGLLKMVA